MFDSYKGKTVLVTGHTGFKGAWLSTILKKLGANVIGYSLEPESSENAYTIMNIEDGMTSIIGDIRNLSHLQEVFTKYQPEYVFHLAAQPIVLESYENPVYTYETNVMGTVNVLECVRQTKSVRSMVNVTTDKVYENKEWEWGYRENDRLNGLDPYSNSKSCSELVTSSYIKSFFSNKQGVAISTVRAGNVIGGGDRAINRIVPDCVRSANLNEHIILRNPTAIRPFQHVLEPLFVYLLIALKQEKNYNLAGCYNVGPNEDDCITTEELVKYFCKYWGENISYTVQSMEKNPHEAKLLKLDCSKLKSIFGWKATWGIKDAVKMTVEWEKAYMNKENMKVFTEKQIEEYFK